MQNAFRTLSLAAVLTGLLFTGSALAINTTPGKGVTVRPARATWNTGFFQEAIVRQGLKELGYKVKKPKELANSIFFKSVTLGDIDYWTNGWFPMHDAQLPKNFDQKAVKVGYVVKNGGLQGYLVSKKEADKFHITSLADFKRDEVRKAFDRNGDGKADLTGPQLGWATHDIVAHHMKVYGLEKAIKPSSAAYEAGMAATLAAYKSGEPIFFYTWAPNWTIHKLIPGKDVVWINVPEINPTDSQKSAVARMSASGVEGAVSDPIKLGLVISDIRIVANKKFLEKNPAAAKFFELFALPLADINAQNDLMNDGEKSAKDVERHAAEWIKNHQEQWNSWLDAARKAAQ